MLKACRSSTNLILAERRRELFGDADDRVGKYTANCVESVEREAREEVTFNPEALSAILD